MGYSGQIIVARSEQPLAESPAVDGVGVLNEMIFAGGWRCAWLDGVLPGSVPDLVAATGAPALGAYIFDSDLADLTATSPGGVRWHTYLHPAVAEEFNAPPLDQTPAEIVAQAVAWVAEAGFTVEPAAVKAALDARNTFAEDTLLDLLKVLGIAV